MQNEINSMLPMEIEKKSFTIITEELGDTFIPEDVQSILKRVIHTTADFEYVKNLCFSKDVVSIAHKALSENAVIVTDTQMVKAGINKENLLKIGCRVECFMSDEDVANAAKENGTTRAVASIDKALATLKGEKIIFAIGNAPTALIRIHQLIEEKKLSPALIIAVPVGFVNVVESKELIISLDTPSIVAKGRKGGSNVAAAICNSLIYKVSGRIA